MKAKEPRLRISKKQKERPPFTIVLLQIDDTTTEEAMVTIQAAVARAVNELTAQQPIN